MLLVILCTSRSNIQNSIFCPHSIYVFCVVSRRKSDYLAVKYKLLSLYNRGGWCLLCGTV